MPAAASTIPRPSGCATSVSMADERLVPVELQASAEKGDRVDVAERDEGVGHCRLGPAQAVAGRPRIGAGALRTHGKRHRRRRSRRCCRRPAPIEMMSVASEPRGMPAILRLARQRRQSAANETDVEARAAHVGADHVDLAAGEELARYLNRGGGRSGGTRANAPRRVVQDPGNRRAAPVALDDQGLGGEAAVGKPGAQAFKIAGDGGKRVGAEHGRRRAVPFAELGQYVGADHHRERPASRPPGWRGSAVRARD